MSRANDFVNFVPAEHAQNNCPQYGLTIREAFAMAAMQGLCSNPHHADRDPQYTVAEATRVADALIAELSKVQPMSGSETDKVPTLAEQIDQQETFAKFVNEWPEQYSPHDRRHANAMLASLRALSAAQGEIARYREALKRISLAAVDGLDGARDSVVLERAIKVAKRALSPPSQQEIQR